MKKTFLLAISNIRKSKGHTFSFFILIMLAMAMLTAGVITYFDTSANFERRYQALNAEDGMIAISDAGYSPEMFKDFSENEKVKSAQLRDIMLFTGSFEYSNGEQMHDIVIYNKSEQGEIGKTQIIEEDEKKYERACYLPLIMKTGGGYKLGDEFTISNYLGEYTVKVQGFFDNVYFGSTDVVVIGFMFSDECFEEYREFTNGQLDGKYLMAKMHDRDDSTEFIVDFYTKYCDKTDSDVLKTSCVYSNCKSSRIFLSVIIASIIVAFSLIIVIISLVVIRFRIINSIQGDIKNIGALKAMGYTSKNLIVSYMIQFGIICLGGTVFGVALASCIMPFISNTLASQSGMVSDVHINPLIILILSLSMVAIVTFTVFLASIRIKKLHPIVALRNGFETHNFKKNYFPFATAKLGKNAVFALKNALANKGQNLMVCIIIAILSFVCMFVYTLYYNLSVNSKTFVQTISGEVPSIIISQNIKESDENLQEQFSKDSRVRQVIYYTSLQVSYKGAGLMADVTDDFSKMEVDICYDGRSPKHENEIAVGGLFAKDYGVSIGDEIEVEFGDSKNKYLVVGLVQTGNNMGYDAQLTTKGMKALSSEWNHSGIYVYLNEGIEDDEFIDDINDEYGNILSNVVSVASILDAQMGAYIDVANLITLIIAFITCLVITMILYLVIKTMMVKNRKSIGIQKALGYTTKQLVLQMALTFIPVTIIGSLIGLVMGIFITNPAFALCLRATGVMRSELTIMSSHFALISLVICVYSFLIALLISIKIKTISAYKMLTDE